MDPRVLLDIGFPCSIYSRSKNQWNVGIIDDIFIDPATNKEWLIVKYGNNQTKKIQRLCDDIQAIEEFIDDPQQDPRILLDVGSTCEVYSRSKDTWFIGIVHNIYIDNKTKKEWLIIKYGEKFNKTKKMQRFCSDLQINDDDYEYQYDEFEEIPIDEISTKTKKEPAIFVNGWMKLKPLSLPPSLSDKFSKMIKINDTEFIITTSIGQHVLSKNADFEQKTGIHSI